MLVSEASFSSLFVVAILKHFRNCIAGFFVALMLSSISVQAADEGDLNKTALTRSLVAPSLVNFQADNSPVSKREALLILRDYFILQNSEQFQKTEHTWHFSDLPETDELYPVANYFCRIVLMSCSSEFQPSQPVSFASFLKLSLELAVTDAQKALFHQGLAANEEWFAPYLHYAYHANLLDEKTKLDTLSHAQVLEFLYRLRVVQLSPQLPVYTHGEVIHDEEISAARYYNIQEIQLIVKGYDQLLRYLEIGDFTKKNAMDTWEMRNTLIRRKELFRSLIIKLQNHPLWMDQTLPTALRVLFTDYDVRDLLGEGIYDFHRDQAYRKHNIRAALDKMQGVVLQPGEEYNYWNIMQAKGMEDIGMGWVVEEGKEKWQWGGGLCGSATTLFRAAWFAGLDIVERRPHTVYYHGLYDLKDIGLDAAVFQFSPNLRFKNDTNAPVVFYVRWNDTKDAVHIQLYGQKFWKSMEFPPLEKSGRVYTRTRILEPMVGDKVKEMLHSSYKKFE